MLLSLLSLGTMLAQPAADPVSAQGRAPVPVPGAWCGATHDGGRIEITVSTDGRFVENAAVSDVSGATFSTEENNCPVSQAQIAGGKFIFRCGRVEERDTRGPIREPGNGGRCTVAPCRGNGGGRTPAPGDPPATYVDMTQIKGTLRNAELLRGSYTAIVTRITRTVNGNRTQEKRIVGNFIAWPETSAPCP